MSKKVLFIDRDGTLVIEPPVDYQLDSLEKLEFYPKVMRNLGFIRSKLDFEFAMVTNQDGLGTASFPEETFWPAHNLMMKTLEGEGITFDEIFIDRSMPEDMAPTRKPRTGMLTKYLNNPEYDLAGSFVIGDRPTDVELAKNLGCRAIYLLQHVIEETQSGMDVAGTVTIQIQRHENIRFLGRAVYFRFPFSGKKEFGNFIPIFRNKGAYLFQTFASGCSTFGFRFQQRSIILQINSPATQILRSHAGANRQAWRSGPDDPCERRFGSGRASHHRGHCDCIRRLHLSGIGKQAWHRALWLCPDDG